MLEKAAEGIHRQWLYFLPEDPGQAFDVGIISGYTIAVSFKLPIWIGQSWRVIIMVKESKAGLCKTFPHTPFLDQTMPNRMM